MTGYFKLVLACIFWGIGMTAARYGVVHIGPYLTSEFRFLLTFLFFLPFLFYPKPIRPSLKTVLYMIPLGLTGYYMATLFAYMGLNYTTGTTASIIIMSNPMNIAILSYFFLKDRLNAAGILSIMLSITGALIVVVKGNLMSFITMDINTGNLLLIGSTLSWSTYSILIKKFENRITSIENVTYGALFATLAFLPSSVERMPTINVTIGLISALLFLSLFNTNISFYLWSEGIKEANPNAAAIFYGLFPLSTAITENIVFGEILAPYHIAGAAMIFLGILLYVLTKRNGLQSEVADLRMKRYETVYWKSGLQFKAWYGKKPHPK